MTENFLIQVFFSVQVFFLKDHQLFSQPKQKRNTDPSIRPTNSATQHLASCLGLVGGNGLLGRQEAIGHHVFSRADEFGS